MLNYIELCVKNIHQNKRKINTARETFSRVQTDGEGWGIAAEKKRKCGRLVNLFFFFCLVLALKFITISCYELS